MNSKICSGVTLTDKKNLSLVHTVFSPGRMNLIGEHTDYNGGRSMPFAIGLGLTMEVFYLKPFLSYPAFVVESLLDEEGGGNQAFAFNLESVFELKTENANRVAKLETLDLNSTHIPHFWLRFPLGAMVLGLSETFFETLNKKNQPHLFCYLIRISSNLPLGAGLSSSAALSCGLLKVMEKFETSACLNDSGTLVSKNDSGENIENHLAIPKKAMYLEHIFLGVKCGLMDQTAICFSKKDHVLELEFGENHAFHPPFVRNFVKLSGVFDAYKPVAFHTGVQHSLASTEYNLRRKQCDLALKLLNHYFEKKTLALGDWSFETTWHSTVLDFPPGVCPTAEQQNILAYFLEKIFSDHKLRLALNAPNLSTSQGDSVFLSRSKWDDPSQLSAVASHAILENLRVSAASLALRDGNLDMLSECMQATHNSLRDFYKVSCIELDIACDEILLFEKTKKEFQPERVDGHSDVSVTLPGVVGPRMMGGGFGGSTIALVRNDLMDMFSAHLIGPNSGYFKRTGKIGRVVLGEFGEGLNFRKSQ